MRLWKFVVICFIFPIIFINGCSDSSINKSVQKLETSNDAKASIHNSLDNPLFSVIGVDISNSYEDMTSSAQAICKNIVMSAMPEDEYFIRAISDRSYPPKTPSGQENILGHVKFPQIPPVPNKFNKNAKFRYLKALKDFQAQKTRFIQSIEKMSLKTAQETDIYGFVQGASDIFVNAPEGARKVLMFATDLKDTVGFKCNPDFRGVQVVIFEFLVDADPMKSQKRRDEWVKRLRDWGASEVTVRSAN